MNRQIDNLFDELRLIEAVNAVLSAPQKNLSETRRALKEKLNQVRIPRAVVEEFQPALKNIFQVFQALLDRSEKNFAQAAEQINQSSQDFTNFFQNQFEFFSEAMTTYVDGAADLKLVEKFFSDAPNGIFFRTRDDFVLQMKAKLQKVRRDEKVEEFFAAWRDVTGTSSPADWSEKNEFPILCAFQDCLDVAQKYFSALNKKSQLMNDALDSAIKFVRGEELSRLTDEARCTEEFLKYFCGDYARVMEAEELRKILRETLGGDKNSCRKKLPREISARSSPKSSRVVGGGSAEIFGGAHRQGHVAGHSGFEKFLRRADDKL